MTSINKPILDAWRRCYLQFIALDHDILFFIQEAKTKHPFPQISDPYSIENPYQGPIFNPGFFKTVLEFIDNQSTVEKATKQLINRVFGISWMDETNQNLHTAILNNGVLTISLDPNIPNQLDITIKVDAGFNNVEIKIPYLHSGGNIFYQVFHLKIEQQAPGEHSIYLDPHITYARYRTDLVIMLMVAYALANPARLLELKNLRLTGELPNYIRKFYDDPLDIISYLNLAIESFGALSPAIDQTSEEKELAKHLRIVQEEQDPKNQPVGKGIALANLEHLQRTLTKIFFEEGQPDVYSPNVSILSALIETWRQVFSSGSSSVEILNEEIMRLLSVQNYVKSINIPQDPQMAINALRIKDYMNRYLSKAIPVDRSESINKLGIDINKDTILGFFRSLDLNSEHWYTGTDYNPFYQFEGRLYFLHLMWFVLKDDSPSFKDLYSDIYEKLNLQEIRNHASPLPNVSPIELVEILVPGRVSDRSFNFSFDLEFDQYRQEFERIRNQLMSVDGFLEIIERKRDRA
jgi:hypothetical protein